MAINVYSGRPRSGKSYSVVQNVILPALSQNRKIVTNLPLNMPALYADFPSADVVLVGPPEIRDGFLDLDARPDLRGSLYVIDECWKFWPNGKRMTDLPAHHQTFFSEHGHFVGTDGRTTDIVLVCQSLAQITPAVRELVDTTFITSKLDKVGSERRFRFDIYSGPQQLTRPDFHSLIRQGFSEYSESVYRYYKSHTRNETEHSAGVEKMTDTRATIFSGNAVRLGVPLGLLLLVVSIWNLLGWLSGPERPTDRAQAPTSPSTSPTRSPAPGRPVLSSRETRYSTSWRIAATLQKSDRLGWAILVGPGDVERTIPILGNCSTVRGTRWEWECLVDGERATFWSGDANSSRNSL